VLVEQAQKEYHNKEELAEFNFSAKKVSAAAFKES
jgi:hypothetical protein